MGLGAPGLNVSFVTGFMEENETLAYQYEDARETKLWKKVIAASWRPFWLLALWLSAFARLLWRKTLC